MSSFQPSSSISTGLHFARRLIELDGWKEDITDIHDFDSLPENAKTYVRKIEEVTGIPVGIISVGPDRKQTIIIDEKLKKF